MPPVATFVSGRTWQVSDAKFSCDGAELAIRATSFNPRMRPSHRAQEENGHHRGGSASVPPSVGRLGRKVTIAQALEVGFLRALRGCSRG